MYVIETLPNTEMQMRRENTQNRSIISWMHFQDSKSYRFTKELNCLELNKNLKPKSKVVTHPLNESYVFLSR